MGDGAGTGGSVEEPDCWPVLPPHAANANDEHAKKVNDFAVCDLIFIFFRIGKWVTRFTSPRAGRLEDAIKLLPEPAKCGQSRWPIDCNARLGKTITKPTRRHEQLSGLIHLNWLTIFKSGVEGDQRARGQIRLPVIAVRDWQEQRDSACATILSVALEALPGWRCGGKIMA